LYNVVALKKKELSSGVKIATSSAVLCLDQQLVSNGTHTHTHTHTHTQRERERSSSYELLEEIVIVHTQMNIAWFVVGYLS